MFLAEVVDISKTAYFMVTQNFSQVVTKFIPCYDVTRFDGTGTGTYLQYYRMCSGRSLFKDRSKRIFAIPYKNRAAKRKNEAHFLLSWP